MKTLIAYFSWSSNTKKLIELINSRFSFDVLRIEREKDYSKDYNTCAYGEAKEEWEKRTLPKLKEIDVEFSGYDRILLFFPIWWYTIPMPVGTFVKNNLKDYKGEVVVFANSYTNDPQYMENSLKDLSELNDKINFIKGLFNKTFDEHIAFIKEDE